MDASIEDWPRGTPVRRLCLPWPVLMETYTITLQEKGRAELRIVYVRGRPLRIAAQRREIAKEREDAERLSRDVDQEIEALILGIKRVN